MKSDGLIILGRLSYPSSSASSNRVHLYCKAIKEAKGFPFVINIHSAFTKLQLFDYLGRYEGVPFYYSQKTTIRHKNLLIRNINKIKGIVNSIVIIRRLKEKHNVKVLFFSAGVMNELIFSLYLKLSGISIIKECNEAPSFLIKGRKAIRCNVLFHSLRFKFFDEIIVISDYLYKYYSAIFPKNKIFQIPILVDMDRFSSSLRTRTDGKKIITYVGYMGGNKDGLCNLIEAMAIIHKEVKDVQLELVGSAPKKDMLHLKNKIDVLDLCDIVVFLGLKNAHEVPSILANSDLLVLARPDSKQAKAGFPTKLGEYLASGKPVVITRTGEIPKYLTDNKSAYIAEPDDINSFAEKVIFALNDKNAEKIGANGREVAGCNFDYRLYSKEFLKIIRS